jgi:hypothetical protein
VADVISDHAKMWRTVFTATTPVKSKATKIGIPWRLIHTEAFSKRTEALAGERYYKTGRGRDELDKLQ